ncbi:hypothetical protein C8F01DRAFT_750828 [Mycena amicta]|nr:hypothetical protein C8F01DRAFT_750828 [Mycena amicta]
MPALGHGLDSSMCGRVGLLRKARADDSSSLCKFPSPLAAEMTKTGIICTAQKLQHTHTGRFLTQVRSMSYPNSNWTGGEGYGYGQWQPQTGWTPGMEGDPNANSTAGSYYPSNSSYYPSNTGYPQQGYNASGVPTNAGNPQNHNYQQYVDPGSAMYSPAAATSGGYSQAPYGNYGHGGAMYPSSSQHQHHHSYSSPPPAPSAPTQIQLTEGPPPPASSSGQRSCSHCGATSTPVWRRDPRTHAPLCNACGVYLATRRAPRPQTLIDVDREPASDPEGADPNAPSCSHCGTRRTSAWRRNKAGAQVCNACGVYERMNGRPRPLELRSDKVRPREKHRDRG